MSLRTPLGKVLGSGSAGEGTTHWWVQRVTAIALIPLTLWFAASVLGMPLQSHAAMSGWLGHPWVGVFNLWMPSMGPATESTMGVCVTHLS